MSRVRRGDRPPVDLVPQPREKGQLGEAWVPGEVEEGAVWERVRERTPVQCLRKAPGEHKQVQQLLDAPDVTALKGLRDRAILAALIGSGLRRSEAAALTFDKVTQREGRWVICDLRGKGNRTRTVPIPAWAKATIDAWAQEAGIGGEGRVFRSVHKGGAKLDQIQLFTDLNLCGDAAVDGDRGCCHHRRLAAK